MFYWGVKYLPPAVSGTMKSEKILASDVNSIVFVSRKVSELKY